MARRFCLALDLKNDPKLIDAYIEHHKNVWPEIRDSIVMSGIQDMEIYHVGDRLFMIMETDESFSFEEKGEMDKANEHVAKWEKLMDQYQQRLPFSKSNEKWVLMDRIFKL